MIKVWFIAVVASLGGLAVFVGLCMEKLGCPSEKFDNIDHFRRSQSIREIGERFVRWGVFAEIILGFFVAGWDGWQSYKNDPNNRPVSTANATASLLISGTNSIRLLPQGTESKVGGICFLAFLKKGAIILALDGKSCNLLPNNATSSSCMIQFGDSAINSWALPMVASKQEAAELMNEIDEFELIPLCLHEHTKILGGNIKLILNGSVEKSFIIPSVEVSGFNNGNGWKVKFKAKRQ